MAAPTPQASLTILPSVTATSTSNGNDNGSDAGGQTVQITGSGFTNAGGEQVYFGANPATSFTVNSNTSITAVAPASTTGDGPVDVTVTNGGATSPTSPADQFTYIPSGPPDFPVNVVPTSDNGQAEVSWTPAFNEGSPTQSYLVTATDVSSPSNDPGNGGAGLETCSYTVTGTDGPTDSCTVPGLTNGDAYTFAVTATNGLGTSVPSPATTPITIGDPGATDGRLRHRGAERQLDHHLDRPGQHRSGTAPVGDGDRERRLQPRPAPPTGCSAPTSSRPARATTPGRRSTSATSPD